MKTLCCLSCLSCYLLALALTGCQLCSASDPDCNQCEPGALCVELEQQWISRLAPDQQEIHLPTVHEILALHTSRCRGLDHVIVRGSLAAAARSRNGGSLQISTGPMHRLRHAGSSPAGDSGMGGFAHPMVVSHSAAGVNAAQTVRCENTAGRLPSPEASAALCPHMAPAVVVQDIDYGGYGISMTCAICSATHFFASVSTIGRTPHVDIVLPVNQTGDSAVHLVIQDVPAEAEMGPDCYLECGQGPHCIGRAQVCDGVSDCGSGVANASSIDESSVFCSLLRDERAQRLRQRTIAAGAGAVGVLSLLALLGGAVVAAVAQRRLARARAAEKAQQQNLSLVDKAPLI